MLNCSIVELNNTWGLKTEFLLRSLLRVFEQNQFARLTKMELNNSLRYESYQPTKIIETILERGEGQIYLQADSSSSVSGSISITPQSNVLQLRIDEKFLTNKDSGIKAIAFLMQIKAILPLFYKARINAFDDIADFYLKHRLMSLPVCFENYLGWFTLLSPLAYREFYALADLAAAPAYRTNVSAGNEIALTAYPKVLDFKSRSGSRKIIELSQFLDEKRRDR